MPISAARTMFSLAARLFSVAISRLRTIRNLSEAPDLCAVEDAECAGSRVHFGASGEGAGGEGLLIYYRSRGHASDPLRQPAHASFVDQPDSQTVAHLLVNLTKSRAPRRCGRVQHSRA